MSKETADTYGVEEYHQNWVAGHVFKPVAAPDRFPKGNPYTPDQDEDEPNEEGEDSVSNT